MQYFEKIQKINALAKSLKDSGIAKSSDEAARMAEDMVNRENSKKKEVVVEKKPEPVIEKYVELQKTLEAEEPFTEQRLEESQYDEFMADQKQDIEEPAVEEILPEQQQEVEKPTVEDILPEQQQEFEEPQPEQQKEIREPIKQPEQSEYIPEKIDTKNVEVKREKSFFEKIKERFGKKEDIPLEQPEPDDTPKRSFFDKIKEKFVHQDEEVKKE